MKTDRVKLSSDEFSFSFLKKRNLLIFFAVFSIYIGLSLGNNPVFFFGLYCFILLLITSLISYFSAKGLRCKREHLPRIFEDSDVDVLIKLENDSFYPLYMAEIRDVFLPGESYYVNILAQYKIDSKHFVDMTYKGKCVHHRGLYTLGPIVIHSSDPLGVVPMRREISAITDLMVYPKTEEIKEMILYELGTLFDVGEEVTVNSGSSAEFFGIREYRYGDNQRHIHWGLSAKHNKLILKEFEETVVSEVSIFVDLYRYSHTGIGDVSTVEYAIKVAASIAEIAIEKSHQVRVFGMGMKKLNPLKEGYDVPLGAGYYHLITILDKLTFYRVGTTGSFEDEFVEKADYIKRGSTIVLITCSFNFDVNEILSTIKGLVANKVKILFVIIDSKTFIKIWKQQEELQRDALPVEEIERVLRENGCIVYRLKKEDKIGVELSKSKEIFGRGVML